ncbi:MAG TPA: phosphoglycerate kinase [Salinimicrobium sp.]|nr:phosphoglycerate kinase [Salinimicrobium sp.]
MIHIDDYNFNNKKALIRVDFNVPLNDNFEVVDNTRIAAAKPTIDKILNEGGSVVLMSHLGRPKGIEEKYSMKHIVDEVSKVLEKPILMATDSVGASAREKAENLKPGEILLLENLRFYPEETAGDEDFARKLAALGDIYVNDAFGTAHRAHASTTIVARFFEDKCFGYLLSKEIESLNKVLNSAEKPVTAILGGAKVSTKITIIENILDKVDHLLIGGGMTFTFVKALGGEIGNSLVEDDKLDMALQILEKAKEKAVEIHLPIDAIVANSFSNDASTKIAASGKIEAGWMGLDAGPQTIKAFSEVIMQSKIILWNGPMGVFEMDKFSNGTKSIGEAIAKATKTGSFSLVGGGDSVAAVKKFDLENEVSYVSTGGGAMLEMLEGKSLPGIEAIKK